MAVAGLRGNVRQLGATVLAIVIGVAFVAASMTLLASAGAGVREAVVGDMAEHDLVVTEPVDGDQLDLIRGVDEVDVVRATGVGGAERPGGGYLLLMTAPDQVEVTQGRLPQEGLQEVAIGRFTADAAGLGVGDTLRVTSFGTGRSATIVGVVEQPVDPRFGSQELAVLPESLLRSWSPEVTFEDVILDQAPGVSEVQAADAVRQTTPVGLAPGEVAAEQRVRELTQGTDILGAILLGFGAVALATTAIVIANTFAILLAQRVREMALLRCVGATRGQLRRGVLLEALVVGLAASLVGVVVGVALAWVLIAAAGTVDLGTELTLARTLSPPAVLIPALVGTVVTVVAAWWPSRRATRVTPLEALRPEDAAPVTSRPGLLRLGIGVLLIALGVVALVLGSQSRDILVGVAGGLLSFLGVLFLAVHVVPRSVALLGRVVPGGVPTRLAVDNATRNPGRAAATSAALLVGVTLITMTSVGAASAARTADSEISRANAVDAVVLMPPRVPASSTTGEASEPTPFPADVAEQIASVEGVDRHVPVRASYLTISAADDGGWSTTTMTIGIDPADAALVNRAPGESALRAGTVGGSSDMLLAQGIEPGDRVVVRGPGGRTVAATVVEFGFDWDFVVASDVMDAVAPDTPVAGLMLRLADDADVPEVFGEIEAAVEGLDARVLGSAAMRAQLLGVLDVLVLVTTALLGVAVLIAVVGIANTLSLSVLERGRENSLLRALGLTRGQLRRTLATEGVLLAVVSAVLGVVLGVVYAWFGVQTILPEGISVELGIPWGRLGLVLTVALLAGLLASVLPARRAVRVPPAAGLASV